MRVSGLILVIAMLVVASCAVGANGPQDRGVGVVGPMPSILFLNLGGLNAAVTAAGYPRINELLFTMGGSGYGGQNDGIRFGGMGSGGAWGQILILRVSEQVPGSSFASPHSLR